MSAQAETIEAQRRVIERLEADVVELRRRLGQNSGDSGKPSLNGAAAHHHGASDLRGGGAGVIVGEQIPVRLPGVEQDACAEPAEPEPDALDPLDEAVHRLGGPVAHLGSVPGDDQGGPAQQGPAELLEFSGPVPIDQGLDQLGQVGGDVLGGLVIQAAQCLLGMCQAIRTSPWGSPAAKKLSSFSSQRSSRRSWPLVRSRRDR